MTKLSFLKELIIIKQMHQKGDKVFKLKIKILSFNQMSAMGVVMY